MKDAVLLVISCDAYADTWEPFFHFFRKAWPECPFELCLGTNELDFHSPGVRVIKAGRDTSWAAGVRAMLDEIDADVVLTCLEDYFFAEISHEGIMEARDAFRDLGAKYLQLTPTPRPDTKVSGHPFLGELKKGARYRTAVGFGFWDVETLRGLLRDGETAWEMENAGAERAKDLEGFYRTWKPRAVFHNAVVCGKWRRDALAYCRREGVAVDTSKRPIWSARETAWIAVKSLVRRTVSRLPDPLFDVFFSAGRRTLSLGRRLFGREGTP